MPKQTFYVSISDFGSIAGVNPFKSRDEILIKYWCKSNPTHAFQVLKESGYITETDEEVSIAENVEIVEKEFQAELERKRPSNQEDADKIKEKYAKKISDACKKDNLKEKVAEKIQENISSTVNKQCGHNTEKNILDTAEKKSGVLIRKRNSQMYYKVIYEDQNAKFLIGGRVDGISNSDLIVEAKYRTKESNVRKNKYDLFQLLGYLFVTNKSKGKIVQKHGNQIWDSDTETTNEWGIIEITDNEIWTNFLNNDLFSFFEQIKEGPSNFSVIEKPFLTISRGKFYPVSGISEIEFNLIDCLRETFYFLPMSSKPAIAKDKKYTKITHKSSIPKSTVEQPTSSKGPDHFAEVKEKNIEKTESTVDKYIPPSTPTKNDQSVNDTSLCEKFEFKIPNHFENTPIKKNEHIEEDSPSLLLIGDTSLPASLGGTPVKSEGEDDREEILSPILIEVSQKRTSSPKPCQNPESNQDSIETASFSEPSLESNFSEYIEAGNIAEISSELDKHLENKDLDSIENEIYTVKEGSIESASSHQSSVASNISEFLEAGNIAEISSDFITTLEEESDFDIESD